MKKSKALFSLLMAMTILLGTSTVASAYVYRAQSGTAGYGDPYYSSLKAGKYDSLAYISHDNPELTVSVTLKNDGRDYVNGPVRVLYNQTTTKTGTGYAQQSYKDSTRIVTKSYITSKVNYTVVHTDNCIPN